MKLTAKGQKILKVVHLVCAIAWIGSAIVMNTLRHLVDADTAEGMYYMAAVLEAVDMDILVPGAVLCLLTGIVYGAFTNWGFFRHRWLTVKWVITLFSIIFGTFYMGPRVKDNVGIASEILSGGGDAAAYWQNVADSTWSGALQLAMLAFIVVISVFKPWKRGGGKRGTR